MPRVLTFWKFLFCFAVLEDNFTGLVTQATVDHAVLRHSVVCNCSPSFNCASF